MDARQKQAEQEAELLRREKDAEHERKLAVISAKRDIELAKVTPKVTPVHNESSAKVSETFATDWRKLTPEQRDSLRGLTVQQIMDTAVVSERTAQNWRLRLSQEVTQ